MSHIANRPHVAGFILLVTMSLIGLGLFGLTAFAQTLPAQPAPTGLPGSSFDLDGYLWSSTIGWVSLNCRTGGATGNNVCGTSSYRVTVNSSTGNMTGYAWSSNIGWIRFGGLSSFPTPDGNTALNAMVSGNYNSLSLYGWVRACAGTNSAPGTCSTMGNSTVSGGWDGWISLRGATPDYGVSTDRATTNGGGFAWGSTVVHWLSFDLMRLLLPTATLTGTGCSIAIGATTCTATLTWSFSTGVPSKNIRQTSPVVVTNIGGAVPVDAGNAPVTLNDGTNVFRAYSGTTELAALSLTATCGGSNAFFTPPGICDQLPPTVTITTSRPVIRVGDTVTVTWTITPPTPAVTLSPTTQCRVYGPGMPAGVQANPGSNAVSLPIRNATEFKVSCTGTFAATMGDEEAAVTVQVVPVTQEI